MPIKTSFFTAGIVLSSLVMAILVYYAGSKYGPGLTFDSINYLYAGNSLVEKGKLMRPFQKPYVEWPPLYPAVIAMLSYFPGSVLQNLFYFQIAAAALSTGLGCNLAMRLIHHPLLRIAAYISLAFSTPLLLVNHFVWSESFFILLVVLQIQLFYQYIQQPNRYNWWLIAIAGALLCLQRQVGAFFVAGGAFVLLLYPIKQTKSQRLIHSFLYILLASVAPLLLWWIRNYYAKGIIMNDYRDTLFLTPLSAHWATYHDVFASWFLPGKMNVWVKTIVVYSGVIALIIHHRRLKKARSGSMHQPLATVLTYFFCSYFLLLLIVSFIVTEEIDDRKLAPIYIPGILLFIYLLDTYCTNEQTRWKRILIYACLLWTVYPISRAVYNAYRWHHTPQPTQFTQPVEEAFKEKLRF